MADPEGVERLEGLFDYLLSEIYAEFYEGY